MTLPANSTITGRYIGCGDATANGCARKLPGRALARKKPRRKGVICSLFRETNIPSNHCSAIEQ